MAEQWAKTSRARAIAGFFGFAIVASALVNNIPVVLILIPVIVQLSRKLGMSANKLLIPLSYVSILGGTLTLLGTSTNLLVAGMAQSNGPEAFSIFEVTPLAIFLMAWGVIYLRFVAPKLQPDRASTASLRSDESKKKFLAEIAIPEDSRLIGETATKVELFKRDGVRLVDVLRGDASLRQDLGAVELQTGDRVVFKTQMEELLGLQNDRDVRTADKFSSRGTSTVEVLITPNTMLVGRALGALRLRRRYGAHPLAVHRRNQNISGQIESLVLQVGDTLLLEGVPEDIARMAADVHAVNVSQPSARA